MSINNSVIGRRIILSSAVQSLVVAKPLRVLETATRNPPETCRAPSAGGSETNGTITCGLSYTYRIVSSLCIFKVHCSSSSASQHVCWHTLPISGFRVCWRGAREKPGGYESKALLVSGPVRPWRRKKWQVYGRA